MKSSKRGTPEPTAPAGDSPSDLVDSAQAFSRRRAVGLAAAGLVATGIAGEVVRSAPAAAAATTSWSPPYAGYLTAQTVTIQPSGNNVVTVDLTVADHYDVTLGQNARLALVNAPPAMVPVWVLVRTHQDSAGGHSLAFLPGTVWALGVVPALSLEPRTQDTFSFLLLGGVVTGYISGQAES